MSQFQEFEGYISLEVDGREVDVADFTVNEDFGRKPVKVMRRKRTVAGYVEGTFMYDLSVTVVIPKEGDLDWSEIVGAKLTKVSPDGSKRVSYLNCVCQSASEKYSVDNEARRDLKMFAEDKVTE